MNYLVPLHPKIIKGKEGCIKKLNAEERLQ